MTNPSKVVALGGRRYELKGLNETDPYFCAISDGFGEEFSAFCRSHLADDAVCMDVGANIGVTTIYLSQVVSCGTVIAVEPAPQIAELLMTNVQVNRLRDVRVVQCAVGAEDGEAAFHVNSAYGHIVEGSSAGAQIVPVRRVATVLTEQGLDRLDFIKLDVEGYEFVILRDALELIDHHRALVLLEFNAWCQLAYANLNPREVLQWLFEHFCYVARLSRSGEASQLLDRIDPADALDLLHQTLVRDQCVTDLVVTNYPERLELTPRELRYRLDAAVRERDAALAERNAAVSELDAALHALAATREDVDARMAAVRNSRSWRVTAPFRTVSGLFRNSP